MKTLSDYMKMNYRMEIVEDAEEGGFVVSFPELSGCLTCGDTKEKAIANEAGYPRVTHPSATQSQNLHFRRKSNRVLRSTCMC